MITAPVLPAAEMTAYLVAKTRFPSRAISDDHQVSFTREALVARMKVAVAGRRSIPVRDPASNAGTL